MRLYIVHIQSKYNNHVVNTSDHFDDRQDAIDWGRAETFDERDLMYRIEVIER